LAEKNARQAEITNVTFRQADIFDLPFSPASFDHIFVCFVLEHLAKPQKALEQLRPLLKEGGTITVIEGDHGSTFFSPDDAYARKAVQSLVTLQEQAGGNALIGRELYPLVSSAGYRDVCVSPRMVYVDSSRPALVEGFTKLTFTAMVEGVGVAVVEKGLMSREEWDLGIAGLYRAAEPDGVFCYTFFKAIGRK